VKAKVPNDTGTAVTPRTNKRTSRASVWTVGLAMSLAIGGAALAQQSTGGGPDQGASAAQDQSSSNSGDTVQEVVVTATRRSETIQNVPFTVQAVTNQDIMQQGLKQANDLDELVPGMYISPNNSAGTAGSVGQTSIAIRGINAEGVGASTTGIYINDVPLQQRNVLGPAPGGTVLPQLFDLDRVEVLMGPQGTLYGGSSEGGTVRFITPQPSFTGYTANALLEGSNTQYGDPNVEGGLTLGGPFLDDTLAGRLTVWDRHDGGYIDHVSQFTGNLLPGGSNTNSEDHQALNAALAWKPFGAAVVTLNYNFFYNFYRDSDEYWGSIPKFSQYLGPGTPGTLYTYCPCNFGPYKSGQNTNIGENFYTSDSQLSPLLSPHSDSLSLPSLTIEYPFQAVDLKLISAYAETVNDAAPNFSFVDTASRSVTPLEAPYNLLPNNGPFIATLPDYSSVFYQNGKVTDLTEEFRATSSDPDARLTWVAGAFYDLTNMSSWAQINANTGDLAAASLFGAPSAAGTPFESLNGIGYLVYQSFREIQKALYGQATFKITEQLRASVGERITWDTFTYAQEAGGALFGYPPGVVTPAGSGTVSQTPTTPLFGLQYVVNPDLNFYANASKGFRSGGVNTTIPPACAASLAAVGYTSAPLTYHSDSLWNYELGTKWITWDGRASIDASAYYIDWSGVQSNINLTCGLTFIGNIAKVVSKGGTLEAKALLFPGFEVSLNGAYTDARYPDGLSSDGILLIGQGNEMPYSPVWTGNLSAQYRFQLADRPAFVRADYSYQGQFYQTYGPGTEAYLPDAYRLPGFRVLNMRAGMTFGKFEVDAFVNNVTNSQDLFALLSDASGPGRVGCTNAACTGYLEYAQGTILSTYRPRTIGIDLEFKY
jgi:iron complex outermembrane recepter protein